MEIKQYEPQILEKRRKYVRYKGKVDFYKKLSAALMVLALGIGYLLCMALRGNLNLAKQLQESKTITIMPDGRKVLTSK
jgi:hypothetical protein